MDGDKGFSTYIVSKAPFRGTLVARALGGSGEEIGRARQGVSFEKDDAKYVTFKFQPEMDTGLVCEIRHRPRQVGGLRDARPRSGSGGP
jgi:hypothetical protein